MKKKSSRAANVVASPGEVRYLSPEDRHDGPFDHYEVKEALHHLHKAHKIRKNRKLMGAIKKEARSQMKANTQLLGGSAGGPTTNAGE